MFLCHRRRYMLHILRHAILIDKTFPLRHLPLSYQHFQCDLCCNFLYGYHTTYRTHLSLFCWPTCYSFGRMTTLQQNLTISNNDEKPPLFQEPSPDTLKCVSTFPASLFICLSSVIALRCVISNVLFDDSSRFVINAYYDRFAKPADSSIREQKSPRIRKTNIKRRFSSYASFTKGLEETRFCVLHPQ